MCLATDRRSGRLSVARRISVRDGYQRRDVAAAGVALVEQFVEYGRRRHAAAQLRAASAHRGDQPQFGVDNVAVPHTPRVGRPADPLRAPIALPQERCPRAAGGLRGCARRWQCVRSASAVDRAAVVNHQRSQRAQLRVFAQPTRPADANAQGSDSGLQANSSAHRPRHLAERTAFLSWVSAASSCSSARRAISDSSWNSTP